MSDQSPSKATAGSTSPSSPFDRVSSTVAPPVVFVVRCGDSLAEHLQRAGAQHIRDVEVAYLRLAPELRFAVEHRQLEVLPSLQVALKALYVDAATRFFEAGIVHVTGLRDHPISGKEFADIASAELVAEANALVAARIRAIDESAVEPDLATGSIQ